MTRFRGLFLILAIMAVLGLATNEVRAGTLQAVIIVPGGTLPVTGPFGTLTVDATGEHLDYNVGAINGFLTSHGSALRFANGSGAFSNQNIATNASGAVLNSSGTVQVASNSGGTTVMTIEVFQTDWNTPSGTTGLLINSGKTTFTNTAAGDTTAYNSFYDPTNTGPLPPTFMPIPGMPAGLITDTSTGNNPNSPPGTPADQTSVVLDPFVTPFALINRTDINLTNTHLSGEVDAYGVQSKVTATAVPEPASMVMMLTSMPLPLVVLGLLRRRRRAA